MRRDVVVQLIEGAKNRGHRAYRSVDMSRVVAKARELPENGVPPEIVSVIAHDSSLDKIQVQKAATPVDGRGDLHRAAELLVQTRPTAVVLEKSSYDEADINAQRISALRTFADQLRASIPRPGDADSMQPREAAGKKMRAASAQLVRSPGCAADSTAVQSVGGTGGAAADTTVEETCNPFFNMMQVRRRGSSSVLRSGEGKGTDGNQAVEASVLGAAAVGSRAAAAVGSKPPEGDHAESAEAPDTGPERFLVTTGNAMVDQFEPWYFGVAFAFLFKYCTGMPDMPAFLRKTRYRRKGDAPRIEASLWTRVMARRVEGQLHRDGLFGFVSWNYISDQL